MNDLIAWKTSPNRKPLVIRGARQVGKTWLMKEFAKTHYGKCAYINFENNERMASLFAGNLDIDRIVTALQIESDVVIDANNTLIVFDEVQEVPQALTSLKYFRENAPHYHVMAAGSLLGVALHPGTSFPIGKVDFLDLHPLDFLEFLDALGKADLANLIIIGDFRLISSFKGRFIDLLKQYYYIGGMPESVATFAASQDFTRVRQVQKRLLLAYEQDFSKHAPNEVVPRLRMLWNSIPTQLAKENRKFIYGLVRHGARAREYELALQWLLDCGLLHKVPRVTKPAIPLASYQDFKAFKLYMLDVGLLSAMSELDLKSLLKGERVFTEFKGALTEQFVLQQLMAGRQRAPFYWEITPFYWSSDKGTAEIDFVFQHSSAIVPLEVKAAENLQAKSLKSYRERFSPAVSLRCSLSDFRREEGLLNLPLYAINGLQDLLCQL
jgi:predicted AAA+ superfamily ATPase